MIVVDTSVWIGFLGGKKTRQAAQLRSLIENDEDICICGIVLSEILQGIRNDRQYRHTRDILENLIFFPMTKDTFLFAAHLYRTLRKKGVTIRNAADCMIATVCIEQKVPLLHSDKDFDLIANYFELQILK